MMIFKNHLSQLFFPCPYPLATSSHIFSEPRPHHCIPVDLLWMLCLSSDIASINRKVQSHRLPKANSAFWMDSHLLTT